MKIENNFRSSFCFKIPIYDILFYDQFYCVYGVYLMSKINAGGEQSLIDDFLIDSWDVSSHVKTHTHDFIELAYLEEGVLLHKCNGISRTIRKGNYFIIDYSISHELQFTGIKSKVINCIFRPGFVDKTLKNCKSFNDVIKGYLIRFDKRCNFTPHSGEIFEDKDGVIFDILRKIDVEYNNYRPASAELIRAYLIEIIILTMRKLNLGHDSQSNDIYFVKESVKKYFNEDLQLSSLASELNISLSHLSRKFKKETGCGFKEYLQQIRIEESCRLLINTEYKIADIALRVGYLDIKYFNKVFRKYKMTSPSEFRIYNAN